jgi:NAD dependent epimerase/dehydratase
MSLVLVTGAGGFIGSHVVEHLVGLGLQVRAMVRYNSRGNWGNLDLLPPEVLQQVEVVAGDLKDPDFCMQVVQDCSHILHLGALIAIPYSYRNPMDYVQTNVVGTTNLLNAARRSGALQRFIHTSTSEVYGTALYTPIDEKHPLQPQSPYSASKIGADNMALSYFLSFEMPITIIRPFNTYGPRQSARAVIPTIITQLISNLDVKLGSLEPKRDFLYVKDTAAGFWQVGTHPSTVGEVVNLGTGISVTIGQLYERLCNMTGRHPALLTDTERIRPKHSEVLNLECNAAKALQLTGWQPTYDLQAGLEETIAYIREQIGLYKPSVYSV